MCYIEAHVDDSYDYIFETSCISNESPCQDDSASLVSVRFIPSFIATPAYTNMKNTLTPQSHNLCFG